MDMLYYTRYYGKKSLSAHTKSKYDSCFYNGKVIAHFLFEGNCNKSTFESCIQAIFIKELNSEQISLLKLLFVYTSLSLAKTRAYLTISFCYDARRILLFMLL